MLESSQLMRERFKSVNWKKFSQKFFMGAGILFVSLIILAIGTFVVLHQIGTRMDESSEVYADEIIQAVANDWDDEKLWSEASTEFKDASTRQEIRELLKYFDENLGKLEVFHGARGESGVFLRPFYLDISAGYTAYAEFEKGDAEIELTLTRKDDKWQVYGFLVNSNNFKK